MHKEPHRDLLFLVDNERAPQGYLVKLNRVAVDIGREPQTFLGSIKEVERLRWRISILRAEGVGLKGGQELGKQDDHIDQNSHCAT